MESRNRTRVMRPDVGQLVMVRKHGARGVDDVAWGTVVGGTGGRYQVKVEGSFPDPISGKKPYGDGDVVEFRRTDGFSVMAIHRAPFIRR